MEPEELSKDVLEDIQGNDCSQLPTNETSRKDQHVILQPPENSIGPDEPPTFSTMTLNDGSHFFIEHIDTGTLTSLQDEKNGERIGASQVSSTRESESIPILLHVAADTTSTHENITNLEMGDDIQTTMYTIHLTESGDGEDDKKGGTLVACDGKIILHEQALSVDLPFLPSPSKLEEFMDVVTTYKCKFCRFSCAWKSGLMSHIRSCHLEANEKQNDNVIQEHEGSNSSVEIVGLVEANPHDVEGKTSVENKNKNIAEVPMAEFASQNAEGSSQHLLVTSDIKEEGKVHERHIFLCGQCSRGFPSLEQCKKHMVKDHDLELGISKRKQYRKRIKKLTSDLELLEENKMEDLIEEGEEHSMDRSPGKRKIRTPKALEEDFFLDPKRKRVRRDGVSDRSYRCSEKGCGYRFKTDTNLQYHKRCHTLEEKAFGCPECEARFEHWRGLIIHLWNFHSIDLDLYACHTCEYKSYSLFKLENHQRIHGDAKEFTCATCGKSFKQISQLRNHHVIHLDRKNMPEKRWYSEQECAICGRHFSDSKCLRKHQQAVHNKMKPYVCTFCGHASARKAMLELHMRQHTGDKPFLCEHCDYRTGDHNSLRRHRMRHTGTKPYKCPHCSYACIQAISYKMHLKNKHPGLDGLYACDLCSFRSVNKENYVNHMSDHNRKAIPTSEDLELAEQAQAPAQLHLPESTLQQLVAGDCHFLPGNTLAAHFIYNCLNALSQDGGTSNLPPGVTTTSAGDGTQTITIQLPSSDPEVGDPEQYYFTVQKQDGSVGHSTDDVLAQETPISG